MLSYKVSWVWRRKHTTSKKYMSCTSVHKMKNKSYSSQSNLCEKPIWGKCWFIPKTSLKMMDWFICLSENHHGGKTIYTIFINNLDHESLFFYFLQRWLIFQLRFHWNLTHLFIVWKFVSHNTIFEPSTNLFVFLILNSKSMFPSILYFPVIYSLTFIKQNNSSPSI